MTTTMEGAIQEGKRSGGNAHEHDIVTLVQQVEPARHLQNSSGTVCTCGARPCCRAPQRGRICMFEYCSIMTYVNLALPDFRYAPGMPPVTAHLYLRMACMFQAAASTESTCFWSPAVAAKTLECVKHTGCAQPPHSSVGKIDRPLRSASACESRPYGATAQSILLTLSWLHWTTSTLC